MSHFFTAIIVPGTTSVEHIEATIAHLLAPYDENRVVDPYVVSIDPQEREQMAQYYQISPHDLAALANVLPEWTGAEGGVDEQGQLYYHSTYNPQSKWD